MCRLHSAMHLRDRGTRPHNLWMDFFGTKIVSSTSSLQKGRRCLFAQCLLLVRCPACPCSTKHSPHSWLSSTTHSLHAWLCKSRSYSLAGPEETYAFIPELRK